MMGRGVDLAAGELPWTGRAQDAIALAREEARVRGEDEAGTEHILLALVHERDGAAMRILDQLDADPVALRAALGGE
jgi:ATP-dependent Clp protease ATP-binding subunit ClpC